MSFGIWAAGQRPDVVSRAVRRQFAKFPSFLGSLGVVSLGVVVTTLVEGVVINAAGPHDELSSLHISLK